jgi:biopolymer transport protein ExbB
MPNDRTCKFLLAALAAAGFSISAAGQDLDTVRESLLGDIEQAQQALNATQAEIGTERQALARQVNQAQNTVLDLRERAVAARRLADEETLSLQRIEQRLTDWEAQSQYQRRLLSAFAGRISVSFTPTANDSDAMDNDIEVLRDFLAGQQSKLYPDWVEERIVLPEGQLATAEVLSLGPVAWYAYDQSGGLATTSGNRLSAALAFEGEALAGIEALRASRQGRVTFDPTLSEALLLAEQDESLLEHLQKGGIWVIPILMFALFATLTSVVKGIYLLRLPKQAPALAERMDKALKDGSNLEPVVSEATGMQADLVEIAIQPQTAEQRDERLYACLVQCRNRLDRWLGAIALTAAVAPLLGLLGTVSGMITTFQLMTLFGSGDASSVSSGISEALVTTELGLVVAIPALLAHALMSRKAKSYYSELESTAINLSQLPLPGRRV